MPPPLRLNLNPKWPFWVTFKAPAPPVAVGGGALTQNVDDGFGLTDAPTFARVVTVADTFGLTDARVLGQLRAIQDVLGLTDGATATRGLVRTLADTLGLTDANVRTTGKGVTVADPFGLTDARAFGRILVRADAFGLTDSRAFTAAYVRTVADPFALTDSRAFVRSFVRNLADQLGLSDLATPLLIPAGVAPSLPPFTSRQGGQPQSGEDGEMNGDVVGAISNAALGGRMGNG
jgi:hypothetical protein